MSCIKSEGTLKKIYTYYASSMYKTILFYLKIMLLLFGNLFYVFPPCGFTWNKTILPTTPYPPASFISCIYFKICAIHALDFFGSRMPSQYAPALMYFFCSTIYLFHIMNHSCIIFLLFIRNSFHIIHCSCIFILLFNNALNS